MKPGDLIEFWDYAGGEGYVTGIIVSMIDHQYCTDKEAIPSACVLYNNKTQIVPLVDDDLPVREAHESR